MSIHTRRERERAERERLIVTTAREMAEAEGWDAVTTRRLAEQIEYSQPVLYSHFAGKDAIMTAVAVDGFTDLAAELHTARTSAADPRKALAAVAAAYAAFADHRPAVYDAMFTYPNDLPFASPDAPTALHAAFDELRQTLRPLAGDDDLDTLAETLWSGLHGLLTLLRGGRVRPQQHERRLTLLIKRFSS
ncbi:MAG: TetR/AcrR family transcriptional regulator [Streptosporangiales bacterium]